MWQGLNHRKFPRTVVACDVFVKDKKNSYAISTVTSNMSLGGVCVMIGKELKKFERVSLKLLLDERRTIECLGRVVWCIPARIFGRQTRTYDTGIEFVNLSTAAGEHIEQYLKAQDRIREKEKAPR